MSTLKEQALSGNVRIPYWLSTSTATGTTTPEEPQKTSKWKTALANVWAGLSGKKQLTTKNFGNNNPYNDGSEFHNAGPFVSQMEHIDRFHKGNEHGSAANSQVFIDGFDDPTHLTFKVEFGEWGAAINDNETIAAIQRSSMATNTLFMDYDCFPMGLLDLNFKIPTQLKFNEQTLYNAYNWLSSRNEDRRAQYLRDFIWGLYDVQRSMPYIFNKISGIDKLTDLDSTRGQRLKDVTITLTCLPDGIDQKMRTLMELYRKAAWNDIYQRWELPDIYRYFKMIIYVFDDRSLHMGGGLFSPDQDAFPIIALECGPCEFVIKNHNHSEYTQNYQDVKEQETTIDIKVLNIKTFEANQMFKNVKYINDIMYEQEHWAQDDSAATKLNGQSINWKYVWMQRQFMMPDEYNAFYRPTEEWDAQSHYFGDENDDAYLTSEQVQYLAYPLPDNTWHRATVTDQGYVINSWGSLWNAVKSIVTANTTIIRDSRQSDRYYFRNDLAHLNPDTFQYYAQQNLIDINIDAVKRDMSLYVKKLVNQLKDFKMTIDSSHALMTVDSSIINYVDKPEEELTVIDLNLDKMKELIDTSLNSQPLPKMILNDLEINDDRIEQHLSELILNLVNIKQELTAIEPNLDKLKEELSPLDLNLDQASQELISIDKNLDNIKQRLYQINKNLLKPDMLLTNIDKDLRILEQSLASLLLNFETPKMKMKSIDKNLDIFKQQLQDLLMNLDKQNEVMTDIEPNLDKQSEEMFALKLNLLKITQVLSRLFINDDKTLQKLSQIDKNLKTAPLKLSSLDKNLDKQSEEMTSIDLNLQKQIEELTAMIINLQRQEQEFVNPMFNKEHHKMNVSTNLIINDSVNEVVMTEQVIDIHKNDMTMQTIDSNTDVEHSPMISAEFNTDKKQMEQMNSIEQTKTLTNQSFVNIDADINVVHFPMTDVIINDGAVHSPMIDIEDDKITNHSPLVETIKNSSVIHSPMIPVDKNDSVNHSPLVQMIQNDDVNHLPMISAVLNTDKQPEVMTSMLLNDDKNSMSFVKGEITDEHQFSTISNSGLLINDNKVSHPFVDELILEKSEHSQINLELVNTEHQQDAQMTQTMFDGTKSNDMKMKHIDMSNEHNTQNKMRGIDQTTEKRENDGLTHIHTDNSINNELSDVEMVKNLEKSEMKMEPLNLNLTKVEDLVDVELVHNDALDEMKMVDIDENLEKVANSGMNELVINDEVKSDVTMNPIERTEQMLVSDNSKMNAVEKNTEKLNMNISDSKILRVESAISSQAQVMRPIISDKLASKITNFTSLDVDSLQNATVEQMNALIGIMEQTVKEVKTEMNMNAVEKNLSKTELLRSHMTQMVGYKHHDFGDDLIKVDANAFERGLTAQKNAQDRMKMNGLKNK